jgi:uncharacterized protein with PIN domain
MAVRCPGCAREYDVTLFAFGRTLWCTCGRRVGMEPRSRSLGVGAERRFLADAMLGRLARWLRLLGFDCAWEREIDDAELVRRGVLEGRIVLSRDRALADEWRVSGLHILRAEGLREQLLEVLRRYELADAVRLFSRCAACNAELRPASPAAVARRVPARVLADRDAFTECPGCGRVYWQGTHAERIRRVAGALLEECRAA